MGKGKKARHSRSVSWHPAWRPDDDSDDDSDGGQPTAAATPAWLKEQRPQKQSLHEVKEEDAENARGPQAQGQAQGQGQAHQVHQQARSEPNPQAAAAAAQQSSSPSQVGEERDEAAAAADGDGDGAGNGDAGAQHDTQADTQTHSRAPTSETQAASEAASAASAAAAAAAGVDTTSISSPVSFSPHPSAHNSGFHVQSGAPAASVTTTTTTTTTATTGSVETAMPTSDDEKGKGNGKAGGAYDEEDSFVDDQFPETIVIEEEEEGEARLGEEGGYGYRYAQGTNRHGESVMGDTSAAALGVDMGGDEQRVVIAADGDTVPGESGMPHQQHHQQQQRTEEEQTPATAPAPAPGLNRMDTAQLFTSQFSQRGDILSRTNSFPMRGNAEDRQQQDQQREQREPQMAMAITEEDDNGASFFDNLNQSPEPAGREAQTQTQGQEQEQRFGGDNAGAFFDELASKAEPEALSQPQIDEADHQVTPPTPDAEHPEFEHAQPEDGRLSVPAPVVAAQEAGAGDGEDIDFDDRLSTQSKPMYEPHETDLHADDTDGQGQGQQQHEQHEAQEASHDSPIIGAEETEQPATLRKPGLTASALKKHNRTISSIFAADEPAEEENFFAAALSSSLPAIAEQPPTPQAPSQSPLQAQTAVPPAQPMETIGEGVVDSEAEQSTLQDQANSFIAAVAQGGDTATAGPDRTVEEEDLAEKWKAMGLTDDDLLLEEENAANAAVEQEQMADAAAAAQGQGQAQPQGQYYSLATAEQPGSLYTPHQPSIADMMSGIPDADASFVSESAPSTSFVGQQIVAQKLPQQQPQQPPQPQTQQQQQGLRRISSFVDAKETYKSPYDLPMDLTRSTRRHHHPAAPKIPPPGQFGAAVGVAPPPVSAPSITPPPPVSSQSQFLQTPPPPPPPPKAAPAAAAPPATSAQPSNFFEELPAIAPRSRPATARRYTPNAATTAAAAAAVYPPVPPQTQTHPHPPPPLAAASAGRVTPTAMHSLSRPTSSHSPYTPPPPHHALPAAAAPPIPPTSVPPPPPPKAQAPAPAPVPAASYAPPPKRTTTPGAQASKYAPGPAAATAAASRYAAPPPPPPAAAAQMRRPASLSPPPPPPQVMPQVPHAPPKSPTPAMAMTAEEEGMYKPLAQDVAPAAAAPAPGGHVTSQTSSTRTSPRSHRRYEPQPVQQQLAASPPPQQASPPLAATNPYEPPSSMVAPLLGGPPAGAPPRSHPAGEPHPSLPDRTLTQSTSRLPQAAAAAGPSYLQPLSVASPPRSAPGAQARTASPLSWPPQQPQQQPKPSQPELEFIAPTDGQELDPLERWKGAPVFKFGFNGLVASTFPKHVPRYATGHMVPRIMPTVGEVRVRSINSITDTLNPSVKFPGPLRSAKAKKDAVAWMSSMIAVFEAPEALAAAESEPEHREKILLWKVVRLLVEHDGVLNGTPACDAAIRDVFASTTGGPADDLSRLDPASFARPEPADPSSMSRVRDFLLAGDSEKAIWEAVDHRLWGHAMLLSSTLENRAIWKQVASEFIRREVNVARGVTESLGAAYEVFAGNAEESVDQLVPPSARAGLQMVSKDARGPDSSRTGLEGLEKWQETLQLILSNRTSNDYQAIVSLARLLASFGRTAASHVCAIFARCALAHSAPTWNIANGVDDGNALFVLLGVDHRRYPATFANDPHAICLTEVYEFATSVLASQPHNTLTHLQAFKLQHARSLAEMGHIAEARHYCESLASVLKSTTKPSPYYNMTLLSQLDELTKRLAQASADTGSSWISKPNINRVSDSVWAKFTSFVAGDDAEESGGRASTSEAEAAGPFANVVGTVSTPPMSVDMGGTYMPMPPSMPMQGAASRYTPVHSSSSPYMPQSPPKGRSSLESTRSAGSYGRPSYSRRTSYERPTPLTQEAHASPYSPYGAAPSYGPTLQPEVTSTQSHTPLSPVAETTAVEEPNPPAAPYMPPTQGYQPPEDKSGYQPPSYQPPSYEPPTGEGVALSTSSEDKEEEAKPKKKSIMDDDDDDEIFAKAESLKKEEKARHDAEAAERVRKAAEEDAKRAAGNQKKGGWLSGWFSRKKDSKDSGGNVVRAKLGEESSFYYDKELKRWVNKKDPNSAKPAASSLPPPPKAGPPKPPMASGPSSRAPSAPRSSPSPAPMMTPPMPGLTVSPPPLGVTPPASGPSPFAQPPQGPAPNSEPRSAAGPSPSPGPGTGPAQSLAPPPKPPTLTNASSIDDLLGAPAPRTHTGRSKRKGRGYVDVMAK